MSRYCPLDKAYNNVCFAMAHDSHTATQDYSDKDDVPENVDQTKPVDEQLADGIRAVRISNGQYIQGVSPVILQHGNPWLSLIPGKDTTFGLLEDYLNKVKTFLDANPDEVVTIIDEGDADLDQVAAVYQDVLGALLFKPDLNQIRSNSWPTLGEMVAKGQRVVVFMSSYGAPTQYPWIIPAFAPDGPISMNRYDAYVPEDPDARPAVNDAFFKSDRWPNPTEIFKLFMLNHQFCDQLHAPDRTEASRAYNKWTVGDLLVENTIRECETWGEAAFPNFLNVDFYQGVEGAHSYVLDLAVAITMCGEVSAAHLIPTLDSLAGGVFLQDTISSAHPQGLRMGRVYQLLSMPTLSDGRTKLAVSALWQEDQRAFSLVLQPADATNLSQQWRLVYNTPHAGVALLSEVKEFAFYMAGTDEIGNHATLVNDVGAFHDTFTDDSGDTTGWEINTFHGDSGAYWIRHAYNSDRHFEVAGDACNEGDPLQIYSWQDGDANQLFFFSEVTK